MRIKSYRHPFLLLFLILSFIGFSQSVKFSELKKDGDGNYYYKDKLFTGKSILSHANNKKWQEVEWKNGKIDGLFRSYFETGIKETEIEYTAGKRNGTYKSWYSNGKPEEFSNYKQGVLDGPFKSYYQTGTPKKETNFIDYIFKGKELAKFY